MTIREQLEERELEYLSSYAAKSIASRGKKDRNHSVISDRYFKETETESYIVKHSAG